MRMLSDNINILTITIIWILAAFTMTHVYGGLSNNGIDWIKFVRIHPVLCYQPLVMN
jgi:hypothetical protein